MQSWAAWPDCAVVTSCNMPVFTSYVSCYGKLKYCWACCWYADNPQCQTAYVLPQARSSGLCMSHMTLSPDMFGMIFLQLPNSFFVPLKQQLYQVIMKRRLYGHMRHKFQYHMQTMMCRLNLDPSSSNHSIHRHSTILRSAVIAVSEPKNNFHPLCYKR